MLVTDFKRSTRNAQRGTLKAERLTRFDSFP